MDKQEIYALLRDRGLWHEVTEHPAVFNMAEMAQVQLPYPQADAKNMLVRDDKKRSYYLLTVRGDKRVDLKAFRARYGTRMLSFASPQDLWELLQLTPGSVSPLGLLNDTQHRVQLYLDAELLGGCGLIGVHPNDNTATVWLRTAELIELLRHQGSTVVVAEFAPQE
ncbi:MAG: prolyl-tRNA synthetase associated domain-containing protein [Firmicutes bacterium]|nr:prolyl-tRNA synthetase associated domain-containing protein [Bacillota bacterium]MBR6824222.1 prolyl-tRNA synthetase associated domain-containing protein [Bacillota bacterium]MBR7112986.1 prolyl-tRNA synthetase associated domain-containing protein [Bacillota bacterium]